MPSASAFEPLNSWADLGTLVGGIATAIAALAAFFAAGFAYWQIRAGREAQRETVARQTYGDYLKLAIQYPDFASGSQPADALKFEQHEWFVSYMLNACEHILLFAAHSREWRHCVRAQLGYHRPYLCENDWFRANFRSHYSRALLSLIDELCGAES
jgi:hypothetical protein